MLLPTARNRVVALATTLVAVGAAVMGCSNGQASSAGPTPTPAPTPAASLKVCTTGDYQPLTYLDPDTKQYTGIDIDMARDLAAHLGRTAEFVPTTWSTMMADLTTPGKCDIVMGGVSQTAEREQQADFTQPYLPNGKTPLTTTDKAPLYQTVDQINQPGVRVIEDTGGTNEAFAKQNLPAATLISEQDNTKVFGEILAGRADVMITDAIEAEYQAKQNPGLVAVHPDQPFTSDHKAYMLPKNSPLTPQVDQWLTAALADGTFNRFYQQWVG